MAELPPTASYRLRLEAPSRVLAGESWPVVATLHNDGDEPLTVDDAGPPSPVGYHFEGAWPAQAEAAVGPRPEFERSARAGLAYVIGDARVPPRAPRARTAAPGASLTFKDDPAASGREPLPPGRWQVTARCTLAGGASVASDAIELIVEQPQVQALVEQHCPAAGAQVFAYLARGDDASAWALMLRERPGALAAPGAAHRVAQGLPGVRARVALALHLLPRLQGRWVAWQDGDRIAALQASGKTVTARPDPWPSPLPDLRLLHVGFHGAEAPVSDDRFDPGFAWFFAALVIDGATWLQPLRATREALTALPRWRLSPRRVRALRVRRVAVDRTLEFFWLDDDGLVLRLVSCRVDEGFLDGTALASQAGAIEPRTELVWPAAAVSLHPLGRGRGPAAIDWLEGPVARPDGAALVRWRRLALEGDAPASGMLSAELALPRADGPGRWQLAIAARATADNPADERLLVAHGRRLWLGTMGGADWRLLHTARGEIAELRLLARGNGHWAALFVDPARGVVAIDDPERSAER